MGPSRMGPRVGTGGMVVRMVRRVQQLAESELLEVRGRKMTNPSAEIVSGGSDFTPGHDHEFSSCSRQLELTTPQLRKLVFYRGEVTKCWCGVIRLEDGTTQTMYSRNGARITQ